MNANLSALNAFAIHSSMVCKQLNKYLKQYLKKEKQKKKLDKEEAHIKPVKSHKGFSVSSVN